ncbi:hypothetical protein XELAEV_18037527mg [Xenopus laevis]|uniref:Uncharacterized protein n=1 Tax=Xenopus laevis TaxID=8355 RepID=A0A974CCH4_XENLA|nr:hypothetical protein XELAEV_18037527mg [Xenopus laevis]
MRRRHCEAAAWLEESGPFGDEAYDGGSQKPSIEGIARLRPVWRKAGRVVVQVSSVAFTTQRYFKFDLSLRLFLYPLKNVCFLY